MNNGALGGFIVLIVVIAILVAIVVGGIKTFKRNWIAALVLLIFLSPIWLVWAIIEVFRGPVNESEVQFGRNGQNVNVTVVNQTGETSTKHATIGSDAAKPYVSQLQTSSGGKIVPQLSRSSMENVTIAETKVCPHCAEDIRVNAKICRYCNRDV